jgi:putative transposase
VCRKLGISEAILYVWKDGELSTSELRKMRQLEEENARLKRLVADLTHDKVMLQDLLS